MSVFSVFLFSLFVYLSTAADKRSFLIGGDGHDLVQTPHGFRPSKCVHRHDEDAVITELESGEGVEVYYPGSDRTLMIPADEDCIQNARELYMERQLKRRLARQGLQEWQDYASYTCPSPMANFTSTYVIPNENPQHGSQLLYYFIGYENLNSGQVTIVQPVVNYDYSGQFPAGWSMEPWNCCPAGQTHEGKNVVMSAGEQALAWIYTSGDSVIIGQSKADKSSPTTLTVKLNKRVWDWAAATLEDYSATCAETNSKPFICQDMVLTSMQGQTVTPQWKTTGQTACRGGVVVNSPASVSIYGQNKP